MGRFVNPNNSAFQTALNSEIYVDKTGLIEYTNRILGSSQAYVCNSRPRRFGKSVTANMLAAYYSLGCDSRELFHDLNISKCKDYEKHLNKYDVIHFDVQWLISQAENLDMCVAFIESVIVQELHEEFPEIVINTSKLSIALAEINKKTGRKFVIIIDEWDVLFRDYTEHIRVWEQYINLLGDIFNKLESIRYIQLAYLTGIFPISATEARFCLKYFKEYSMLDAGEFAPYMGFKQEQVEFLCRKYEMDLKKTTQWYGGYSLDGNLYYNPFSVVNNMIWGKYKSYWAQTGSHEILVDIIQKDYINTKADIYQLLQSDSVKMNEIPDAFNLLIHLGYLAYVRSESVVRIPNQDVYEDFLCAIESLR